MTLEKVEKMLELFFAFHDVEGRDSLNIEENLYNDRFFRWKKDSFKHGKKFTVIFNDLGIKMFDTVKVRERLGANLEKIKNNNTNTLFAVDYDIVKDLIMNLNIEPITDEDREEFESWKKVILERKNHRETEWKKTHCTCDKPIKRTRQIDAVKVFEYCLKCNKAI